MAATAPEIKRADSNSLQQRALKVNLKVYQWTRALGENAPKVLDSLKQRIGLGTGRALLFPRKQASDSGEPFSQPLQQMITGLQCEELRP
jgi:hypothetical protein